MLALGSEEGIALADRLNLPAVFILRDRRVRLSAAAEGLFVPTAPDYEVLKP
jgi:hypothetical protein